MCTARLGVVDCVGGQRVLLKGIVWWVQEPLFNQDTLVFPVASFEFHRALD